MIKDGVNVNGSFFRIDPSTCQGAMIDEISVCSRSDCRKMLRTNGLQRVSKGETQEGQLRLESCAFQSLPLADVLNNNFLESTPEADDLV